MSELEKLANKAKFNRFMKRFGYWGIMGIAVFALCLTIIVTNVQANKNAGLEQEVSTNAVVFSMPVASTTLIKGYSDTELQYNSTLNCWRAHYGVDLAADAGSEVFAVLDGTVKSVTTDQLNGTVIVLSHAEGFETIYGSLNKTVNVSVGETVTKGQQIGLVSTSASNEANDGAHLHFEVVKDGLNVDPSLYIAIK